MKLATAILIASLILLGYSTLLRPYKNAAVFEERYLQMKAGDSRQYQALRDEMLTPKFKLQDYGVTGLFLAFGAWLFSRARPVPAPRSLPIFLAIAVAAPCLWTAAYYFDLMQAFTRGEFPHWADSMAIPLSGIGFVFWSSLFLSLLHLALLVGVWRAAVPLRLRLSWRSNPWLLFMSAVTGLGMACSLVLGRYWYAIPLALWLYLFLGLAAVRRARKA